jgi:hypothetical protein
MRLRVMGKVNSRPRSASASALRAFSCLNSAAEGVMAGGGGMGVAVGSGVGLGWGVAVLVGGDVGVSVGCGVEVSVGCGVDVVVGDGAGGSVGEVVAARERVVGDSITGSGLGPAGRQLASRVRSRSVPTT